MLAGKIVLPWPVLLAAIGIAPFFVWRNASPDETAIAVASVTSLLLLAFLVQRDLRLGAGNAWAADAATAALVIGSPLLLGAVTTSPLPVASLLLFGGFLLVAKRALSSEPRRLLAAGLSWCGSVLLIPASSGAVVALVLWAMIVLPSRGGALFGGGLRAFSSRALALLPPAAVSIVTLVPDSLLPDALRRPWSASSSLWASSCCCGPAEPSTFLESSPFTSLTVYPAMLLLVVPGMLIALSRFERRPESMACALVLVAQAALAALAVWSWRASDAFAGTLDLGELSGAGLRSASLSSFDQALLESLSPALPFAFVFASKTLSWLRNRPPPMGPRAAGAALGLIAAPMVLLSFHLAGALEQMGPSSARVAPLAAAAAALLAMAFLIPGSASSRGRIEAAAFTLATTAVLVALPLAL